MPRRSTIPFAVAFVLAIAGFTRAEAGWQPSGVPLCGSCSAYDYFYDPDIVPDGTGGAFISYWNGATVMRVQRLTPTGDYAPGWPLAGVAPTALIGQNWSARLVPDGTGDVFVAWLATGCVASCHREPGYVSINRVTASGALAAGWPSDGVRVSDRAANGPFQATADGMGGVILAWTAQDYPDGPHVYAQRIDGNGAKVWTSYPDAVPVAPPSTGKQFTPSLSSDGSGGATIAWTRLPLGGTNTDIAMQHIDASGVLAFPSGNVVAATSAPERAPVVVADPGGAFVAWEDSTDTHGYDLRVQRLDDAGAPQWGSDCPLACALGGDQIEAALLADGSGGVLVAWSDARSGDADIYAARLDAAGDIVAPWPADGRRVSTSSYPDHRPQLVADAAGGAYVAWDDGHIVASHLDGDGNIASGWPSGGTPACDGNCGGTFDAYFLTTDGAGGALVAWQESRVIQDPFDATQTFAQRFLPDGIVETLASLAQVTAAPDRVRLEWLVAADATKNGVTVFRSSGGEWLPVQVASPTTGSFILYEDRDVVAGTRYGYRLGFILGGQDVVAGETWVDVPTALSFSLEGARPNPAMGDVVAWFTLPDATPATLELLDVAGRLIEAHEVGSLGPGRHALRAGSAARLSPGIYLLRLSQAGRSRVERVTLLR